MRRRLSAPDGARVTRIRELTENPPAERSTFCYMNALSPRNLTVVHRAVPRVEHVPDYYVMEGRARAHPEFRGNEPLTCFGDMTTQSGRGAVRKRGVSDPRRTGRRVTFRVGEGGRSRPGVSPRCDFPLIGPAAQRAA